MKNKNTFFIDLLIYLRGIIFRVISIIILLVVGSFVISENISYLVYQNQKMYKKE